MAYSCIPSIWEVREGGSGTQGQFQLHIDRGPWLNTVPTPERKKKATKNSLSLLELGI